ncbi:NUDIX hydrolase [Magnetofaba australis]|uniref:Putative NUDIX hydrolase n=1 Tax=Magnetofaba australis IT-1 TaxID=1434232 RepID=A0A1Y2K2Q8_9PROT|nr:NUDIX domain-containing protein [Magnetofaba australis]OSM02252.1 putative NUDIX hydrolase [Magnetofaba australis IT-1]
MSEALKAAIAVIDAAVDDAKSGLPEDVFLLVSRLTPMINVDLLIQNPAGHTLLTWRDDGFYPRGWHIPGGIIRFKEYMEQRIEKVAMAELGATVAFDAEPILTQQLMTPNRDVRGHFLSLLIRCRLTSEPDPTMAFDADAPQDGQWRWHDGCPDDLLAVQAGYRGYF